MEESRWEEKGQGQLVNSCPGLLHNLPMMGQEKGSLAEAWGRLSVTPGEDYGAFLLFCATENTK